MIRHGEQSTRPSLLFELKGSLEKDTAEMGSLATKKTHLHVLISHTFSQFDFRIAQSSGCLTLTELCSGCVHSQRVPNQAYAPLLQGWAAAFAAATLAAAARRSATA